MADESVIRDGSQVMHAVHKTPAAAAQWSHMFIDESGFPWVHNMAERNKQSSQRTEQMNKQAEGLRTAGCPA